MSVDSKTLFATAKSVNLQDYLENFYAIEFKGKKCRCPVHGDTNPSGSITLKDTWIFTCFSCDFSNNIVGLVMAIEKCSNFEAAKKICIDMNFYSEEDFTERELSDEEKAAYAIKQAEREKVFAENQKILDQKKKQRAAAEDRARSFLMPKMQAETPQLLDNYTHLDPEEKAVFEKMFVRFDHLKQWYFEYLAYDHEHKSLAIINRRVNGQTFNIKHREKFAWDNINKCLTDTRMPGKWISQKYHTVAPFPLDYFEGHSDKRVVICEGEKDALNLLDMRINTLTLGGVSASWEDHASILKGKEVFVWFDNDQAGYKAAIHAAKAIEPFALSVKIVSFMHIDRTLDDKYDVSDYLIAKNFLDVNSVFSDIEYSCFGLTNQLIDDFIKFYDEEKFTADLKLLKTINTRKSFEKDIAPMLMRKAVPVKSETDKEILELRAALSNVENVKKLLSDVGLKDDETANKLKVLMDLRINNLDHQRKMGESDIADALLDLGIKAGTPFASYRESTYVWNGMMFEKLHKQQMIRFVIDWMQGYDAGRVNQKQRTPDMVDKVINHLQYKGLHLEPIIKEQQEQGVRIINMLNGTLHIFESGKTLFKNVHDPRHAAMSILEIEYSAKTSAPKWNRFLKRVLPDELEQKALMQFFGYILYPKHLYETFLFLYGETGGNGKSIVLDVMRKCFGDDVVSHMDLQQLEGHQVAGLEGKLLNIGSEINAKGLNDGQMSTLKKASGGEPLFINPKGKDGYNIQGHQIPKFVFAGNEKPRSNMDGGVFRRLLFLEFKAQFSNEERIDKISERFDDEMSGIINLAIAELKQLIRVGKFAHSKNMIAAKEAYQDQTDPILSYGKEHIEVHADSMIPRKYLYAHYKTWCEDAGHHPLAQKTFLERLEKKHGSTVARKLLSDEAISHSHGMTNHDWFIVGIKFSDNSDITHYRYKGAELATSHSVFGVESKIVMAREVI